MPIRNKSSFYCAIAFIFLCLSNEVITKPDITNQEEINATEKEYRTELIETTGDNQLIGDVLCKVFSVFLITNNTLNLIVSKNEILSTKQLSSTNSKALEYFSKRQKYHFSVAAITDCFAERIVLPYFENENYISNKTKNIITKALRSNTMHKGFDAIFSADQDELEKKDTQIIGDALVKTILYSSNNLVLRVGLKELAKTEIARSALSQRLIKQLNSKVPGGTAVVEELCLMTATVGLQWAEVCAFEILMNWLKEQK